MRTALNTPEGARAFGQSTWNTVLAERIRAQTAGPSACAVLLSASVQLPLPLVMARRYQIVGGLSLRGRNLISIAWLLNAACSFLSG